MQETREQDRFYENAINLYGLTVDGLEDWSRWRRRARVHAGRCASSGTA